MSGGRCPGVREDGTSTGSGIMQRSGRVRGPMNETSASTRKPDTLWRCLEGPVMPLWLQADLADLGRKRSSPPMRTGLDEINQSGIQPVIRRLLGEALKITCQKLSVIRRFTVLDIC